MQCSLADALAKINNAQRAQKTSVVIRDAKMLREVCRVLAEEGYIEQYAQATEDEKPVIRIALKYYQNEPVINKMRMISRPGLRVYSKATRVPVRGFGVTVISTPQGIMSHKKAKEMNLGGELLFFVD